MMEFALDPNKLVDVLSSALDGDVTQLRPSALGASTRETPWRLDLQLDGVDQTILLRYGKSCSRNEVTALRAVEALSLPAPRVLLWDEAGEALGTPIFISSFIEGASLLPPMTAGEDWAIDLYIETVCRIQCIQSEDLPDGSEPALETAESAADVLHAAYQMLSSKDELVESAYRALINSMPELPCRQFSNGDLWPDNLLVRDRRLVGIIDWQHAGFSDPLFEFLLPFFLVPELRGRGIEQRYCEKKGINPTVLDWYHGLEYFDSLRWVLKTGKPYEMHTADSLRADLEHWLAAK